MGKDTTIEWTDHTFNPWWGCFKVSPGCHHCYADTLATRYGHNVWGPAKTTPRRLFGDKHWQEPIKWNKQAERDGTRARVFCASMADVFEDHPQVEDARERLLDLICQTPRLDWLLLTKRPENIRHMVPARWLRDPRPNVWLGTSAENQEYFDARHYDLLSTPAVVHFFSMEPLLGPIDMRGCRPSWVITGGESGNGARPCDPSWVRDIRDQCVAAGVAFFHKQWGGRIAKSGGRMLDGRTWDEFPR